MQANDRDEGRDMMFSACKALICASFLHIIYLQALHFMNATRLFQHAHEVSSITQGCHIYTSVTIVTVLNFEHRERADILVRTALFFNLSIPFLSNFVSKVSVTTVYAANAQECQFAYDRQRLYSYCWTRPWHIPLRAYLKRYLKWFLLCESRSVMLPCLPVTYVVFALRLVRPSPPE
jgi:hypothetical protein